MEHSLASTQEKHREIMRYLVMGVPEERIAEKLEIDAGHLTTIVKGVHFQQELDMFRAAVDSETVKIATKIKSMALQVYEDELSAANEDLQGNPIQKAKRRLILEHMPVKERTHRVNVARDILKMSGILDPMPDGLKDEEGGLRVIVNNNVTANAAASDSATQRQVSPTVIDSENVG